MHTFFRFYLLFHHNMIFFVSGNVLYYLLQLQRLGLFVCKGSNQEINVLELNVNVEC
jgi:hypothetical protein